MAQSYEKKSRREPRSRMRSGAAHQKHVASTSRLGVMGNIGARRNVRPSRPSGGRNRSRGETDGVGDQTQAGLRDGQARHAIGIDLPVCVRPTTCWRRARRTLNVPRLCGCGAQRTPERSEAIVAGVADGCRQAGCALVGGYETAEMPGMAIPKAECDIRQFGRRRGEIAVDRRIRKVPRRATYFIGIIAHRAGVHSNGFSLVRKIVADLPESARSLSRIVEQTVGQYW